MNKEPTIGNYIDDDEEKLIDAIEKAPEGQHKSVLTEKRKAELQATAINSSAREKISLRVPKSDLARVKAKAEKEGIPYQTLINSIIHKAVSD